MKLDKGTFFLYSILVVLSIYFIVSHIYAKNSELGYAIVFIYDFQSVRGPSPIGLGEFHVNDKKYMAKISDGHKRVGQYYITEFVANSPRMNAIKIKTPIDPQNLVPQPPGGWTECPINEDGSIKEKYKRHKKKEQTEENQITGVEFSAQDSAQVTKSSVDFLKQHKNP